MNSALPLIKTVVLGDLEVGKSRLIRQLMDNSQESCYEPTFGVKYTSVEHPKAKFLIVRNRQWEVGGHPAFRDIGKEYLIHTDVVIIVFSRSRPKSWEAVDSWLTEIPFQKSVFIFGISTENEKFDVQSPRPILPVDPNSRSSVLSVFSEVADQTLDLLSEQNSASPRLLAGSAPAKCVLL